MDEISGDTWFEDTTLNYFDDKEGKCSIASIFEIRLSSFIVRPVPKI